MPVTEQNSTVKIAFLNEKILQKNQFPERQKEQSFRE